MKRFCLLVFFALCMLTARGQHHFLPVEVFASAGYQTTDLSWSIAGNMNGTSPNILSEVKWRGITGTALNAGISLSITGRIFTEALYTGSTISSGKASDTDYAEDGRRNPTYQAALDADDGSEKKYIASAGYYLISNRKLRLNIKAGYTLEKQSLLLLDHAGEVPGQKNLRSTYDTKWSGISASLSADYLLLKKITVSACIRYSQLSYRAKADWNLIYSFRHPVSFIQDADGYSIEPSLTIRYRLNSILSFYAEGKYSHAETGTGIDQLFLDSGDTQSTRFNGAYSTNKSILIGTRINF